jgi:hypothetical protein
MKGIIKVSIAICLATLSTMSFAGNPDRAGQAGATQLLINSWGRSSGWGLANNAGIKGVESMFLNVGGLAYTKRTELSFARTNYMRGTDININTFGFSQKMKKGVLGVSLMSFDMGDIEITTEGQPDGGIGTYKPQFMNLGVGYSKLFTKTISGGIVFRVISEGISDVKALGVAFDAGVQYRTSLNRKSKIKKNDIKFGVSVRNIGPDMRYSGDGLSVKALVDGDQEKTLTVVSDAFDLPSLIHIGASYDIRLDRKEGQYNNRLTPALNFTNNSFQNNQTTLGLEFASREMIMFRVGYAYEDGAFEYDTRKTARSGLSAGFTIEIPFMGEKNNSTVALDYSFTDTKPFNDTHIFGIRINLE